MQAVKGLWDVILPVTPKIALIRTSVPASTWVNVITDNIGSDPNECVLKVKWRPRYHGGRPWASPEATAAQMQAIKVQAGIKLAGKVPGTGRDLEGSLEVVGNLGPEPADLMSCIMQAVSTKLGYPLTKRDEGSPLEVGGVVPFNPSWD